MHIKSLWLPSSADTFSHGFSSVCKLMCLRCLSCFGPLPLSHSLRCASCHKRPAFFSVSQDNKKSFNAQLSRQLTVPPDAGRMSSCFLVDRFNSDPSHPCIFPDQKNIRSDPDHHPGHGDHWRLRRVWVFPPQSVHWVGQVDCVRNVPQQTQHCQEKSQPARDWAVLLHGERRVKNKGLLLYTNKNSKTKVSFIDEVKDTLVSSWYLNENRTLSVLMPDGFLCLHLFKNECESLHRESIKTCLKQHI